MPWISLPGHAYPLPNPLYLEADCPLARGRLPYAVRGRAHGDLHPGNIMVPKHAEPSGRSSYVLVDLSRFSDHALLARYPQHLMLYLIADFLPHMSDDCRGELLDLLVGRDTAGLLVSGDSTDG